MGRIPYLPVSRRFGFGKVDRKRLNDIHGELMMHHSMIVYIFWDTLNLPVVRILTMILCANVFLVTYPIIGTILSLLSMGIILLPRMMDRGFVTHPLEGKEVFHPSISIRLLLGAVSLGIAFSTDSLIMLCTLTCTFLFMIEALLLGIVARMNEILIVLESSRPYEKKMGMHRVTLDEFNRFGDYFQMMIDLNSRLSRFNLFGLDSFLLDNGDEEGDEMTKTSIFSKMEEVGIMMRDDYLG